MHSLNDLTKTMLAVKWERFIGFTIFIMALVFVYRHTIFVISKEASINANIHNIYSPISGELEMKKRKPGQILRDRDVLFKVHNPRVGELGILTDYHNFQDRIYSISADIASDKINIKKYIGELLRRKELLKTGAVAKEEAAEIYYKVNSLHSDIEHKNRQMDSLKESARDLEEQLKLYGTSAVYMNGNGVVWTFLFNNGDFVKKGDIVWQVVDTDHMWVDAFFNEKDSRDLFPGAEAYIIADGIGKKWRGKVLFIRRGGFQKGEGVIFDNTIAQPRRKDEKALVTARIEIESKNDFMPEEFCGYGMSVVVKVKKDNWFAKLMTGGVK